MGTVKTWQKFSRTWIKNYQPFNKYLEAVTRERIRNSIKKNIRNSLYHRIFLFQSTCMSFFLQLRSHRSFVLIFSLLGHRIWNIGTHCLVCKYLLRLTNLLCHLEHLYWLGTWKFLHTWAFCERQLPLNRCNEHHTVYLAAIKPIYFRFNSTETNPNSLFKNDSLLKITLGSFFLFTYSKIASSHKCVYPSFIL